MLSIGIQLHSPALWQVWCEQREGWAARDSVVQEVGGWGGGGGGKVGPLTPRIWKQIMRVKWMSGMEVITRWPACGCSWQAKLDWASRWRAASSEGIICQNQQTTNECQKFFTNSHQDKIFPNEVWFNVAVFKLNFITHIVSLRVMSMWGWLFVEIQIFKIRNLTNHKCLLKCSKYKIWHIINVCSGSWTSWLRCSAKQGARRRGRRCTV